MSFVVKAVKGVAKAVGNVISGVVKAVGNVVNSVIDFVVSPFMGLFGIPDMPSDAAETQRQQGVLLQSQGSNVAIPVVYGYRKIGATVTFAETGSTDNKYLWVAYTLCEGGIEGLRELFIDDNQLDKKYIPKLNTGNAVEITDGKYGGRLKLQLWGDGYKSSSSYTADGNSSICAEAPSWEANYTFNGITVLFARYEWKKIETQEDADNNPYGGSIPRIQASILGRRVASLQNTLTKNYTYGGAGYTERYSTNPAEILLDYLRNPYYGKGMSNDEINWDSFETAASKCNQVVEYVNGIRGPILTTNYVLDTGQTIFNNTKILLTNMRGYLPYVQGKYKLKIEDAGDATDITSGVATIVKTFDKDNIIGSITYTGIDRNAKYNQVVVKYVDPDNKWSVQEVVFPESETERLSYQTTDGGRENKTEITFPGCTNYAIAKDFARLIFNKSRYQDSVSFKADSSAFELEPGDNVYIDANVLKFGTDPNAGAIPWRIVSIKVNNDYTFDIGCVRNPDFIYPHTRVGEIDIVLPPYVPKGAQITYPGQLGLYPVGLVPPTNVVLDPEPVEDRPGNGGGTTDPTDPTDGGGVGEPDSPINEDPVNNPPPEAPPEPELEDYVTIDRVVYRTINNQIYADIEFKQPGNAQYESLYIWYKRNIASETVWEFKEVTDKPGEGKTVSYRIGPFIKGFQYSLKNRVKYSTGDFSRFVNTSILNIQSTGEEDPNDYQEVAGSGWTLNTEPAELKRNTYIRAIEGAPVLSGGNPLTPREMDVTVTQEIYNLPINGYIAGMNIYYKLNADTYWNKGSVEFDDTYTEGSPYTFRLPFDLDDPGTNQFFDFVFRWRYKDGTESEVQYRVVNLRVETDAFGNYSFNPFYASRPVENGREDVSAFELITVDNAPAGAVPDARDLIVTVDQTYRLVSTKREAFVVTFNAPNDPSGRWRGIRLYYRKVTPGANPDFLSTDFLPVTQPLAGVYQISQAVDYDEEYEFVIVPVVKYGTAKVETFTAWYGRGAVHTRLVDGRYPNFWELLNFELLDTDVALNRLKTTFPQTDPTVQVRAWNFVGTNDGSFQRRNTNWYFSLEFYHQHITNYTELAVYRRERTHNFDGNSLYHEYYGKGQWEKIDVTTTNTNPGGTVTVNLRAPLSYQNFSPNAGVTQGSPYYSPYASNRVVSLKPTTDYEYILVAKTSTGYSTKGLLLSSFNAGSSATFATIDLLQEYGPPQTVTVSNYNANDAGWLRNLDEAIAPISASNLKTFYSRAVGFTLPSASPGVE